MRTRTLLSITLLGLLLWASSIQANDVDPDTREEAQSDGLTGDAEEGEVEDEEPKKEKTTEIEEEKDVMVLHTNNFARALEETQYLLVEFCKWPTSICPTCNPEKRTLREASHKSTKASLKPQRATGYHLRKGRQSAESRGRAAHTHTRPLLSRCSPPSVLPQTT